MKYCKTGGIRFLKDEVDPIYDSITQVKKAFKDDTEALESIAIAISVYMALPLKIEG